MLEAKGLICPLDQSPLTLEGRTLKCEQGHHFDLAKQGYCHLLPVQSKRSKDPGDSKEMVIARSEFLDTGLYQPIADFMLERIVPLLSPEQQNALADAGCGEGYYLSQLHKRCEDEGIEAHCIGFDISKWAVQRATRRSKAISWLVASNRQPPIEANYLDLVLCMFGFVQYEAFHQCLKSGGHLVLLDAGPNHLIELRELIYDEIKPARVFDEKSAVEAGYELVAEQAFTQTGVALNQEQLQQLMLMTPHFFRTSAEAKEKLRKLERLELTLGVVCRTFKAV